MKIIKLSKISKELDMIEISPYLLECPYCDMSRVYRFNSRELPCAAKCKCCQSKFIINYDFYDREEYDNMVLLECDKCGEINNYNQLNSQKDKCMCGSQFFKLLTLVLNTN